MVRLRTDSGSATGFVPTFDEMIAAKAITYYSMLVIFLSRN